MKKVLLVMCRKVLSDALTRSARDDGRFDFHSENNYSSALLTAELLAPDITVLEIPESGEWTPERCLAICRTIGKSLPGCAVMLLCPEGNPAAVEATIAARREGIIDDFIYYDSSVKYLMSKLETL